MASRSLWQSACVLVAVLGGVLGGSPGHYTRIRELNFPDCDVRRHCVVDPLSSRCEPLPSLLFVSCINPFTDVPSPLRRRFGSSAVISLSSFCHRYAVEAAGGGSCDPYYGKEEMAATSQAWVQGGGQVLSRSDSHDSDLTESSDVETPDENELNAQLDMWTGEAPVSVTAFLASEAAHSSVWSIELHRTIVLSAMRTALNLFSSNQFDEMLSALHYDKLFHTWMLVHTANGHQYIIEKNAVVAISESDGSRLPGADTYVVRIPSSHPPITIFSMLTQAVQLYGLKRIYVYHPFSTNCQIFQSDLLTAAGIFTKGAKSFIYQDVKTLLANLPQMTLRVSKGVTDFVAELDRLLQYLSGGRVHLPTTVPDYFSVGVARNS